jgi:hypothetical protein
MVVSESEAELNARAMAFLGMLPAEYAYPNQMDGGVLKWKTLTLRFGGTDAIRVETGRLRTWRKFKHDGIPKSILELLDKAARK